MRRAILTVAATITLVATGTASGVALSNVIQVRSGDQIIVNKNLRCLVGASGIVCGGAGNARISAEVRSDGQIVILVRPTPHGVYPAMVIQRAECNGAGRCNLVVGAN